ncbi:ATP-grasp domain-containing protein [Rhodobacterales bacterium HKCCE2091]|nr:ATP-grasp domain-containing protein [Rhodobacterales bacterium HKCCE2091]
MTASMRRVLVSSASAKAPLVRAVAKAARRIEPSASVVAGDIDPLVPARYVADDFWLMPRTTDDAVEALVAGCTERGIDAVIPTRDGELTFWARHRGRFADAGIAVIVSDPDAIARCLDKLAFAEFGAATALPVIPAAADPGAIDATRYAVKERFGSGSRGIGLGLDHDAARDHARDLDDPIFQPFVAGPEISIDSWVAADGTPAGVVLRRRDRVVAGEAQVTTTFRDRGIEAMAMRVLSALGLRGPVVMQAIVTGPGEAAVIEVNPRFGGASTTGIAAGLDPFFWSLSEALGHLQGPPEFRRRGTEVRQVRIPSDIVVDDPDL